MHHHLMSSGPQKLSEVSYHHKQKRHRKEQETKIENKKAKAKNKERQDKHLFIRQCAASALQLDAELCSQSTRSHREREQAKEHQLDTLK